MARPSCLAAASTQRAHIVCPASVQHSRSQCCIDEVELLFRSVAEVSHRIIGLRAVLQDVITALAWTSSGQLVAGYASGITQLFCLSKTEAD